MDLQSRAPVRPTAQLDRAIVPVRRSRPEPFFLLASLPLQFAFCPAHAAHPHATRSAWIPTNFGPCSPAGWQLSLSSHLQFRLFLIIAFVSAPCYCVRVPGARVASWCFLTSCWGCARSEIPASPGRFLPLFSLLSFVVGLLFVSLVRLSDAQYVAPTPPGFSPR